MKKLRVAALVTVLLYIMSFSVACSSGKKPAKSEYSVAGVEQSKENKRASVAMFMLKSTVPSKADKQLVLDEIEKKLKDKLNIKLFFFESQSSSYNDHIKRTANGGGGVFFYSEFQMPVRYAGSTIPSRDSYLNLSNIVKEGMAADLTELLPKYAPKLYARYTKEQLAAVSVQGRIYAIPGLFPRSGRCCVTLRKDLADKYNIKGFNGMEDYTSFLALIKEKEPDLIPYAPEISSKDVFCEKYGYVPVDYLSNLVYKWDDPEMKLYYFDELPEGKEVMGTVTQWTNMFTSNRKGERVQNLETYTAMGDVYITESEDGKTKVAGTTYSFGPYADKGEVTGNIDTLNAANSEKLVSVLGSPEIDRIVGYQDSMIPLYWKTEHETVTLPLFPDKKARLYSPSDYALVIAAKDENAREILEFLEWVHSSQENFDLLMYGIKDKHYTLYNEQYVLQGDYAKFGDSAYIGWKGSLPFWNIDYFRTGMDSNPLDKERYKKLVDMNSEYAPHSGFCPDYTPIGSEIEAIYKNEKNNEAVRKKVRTEIQKQLDEWRKARKI